MHLHTIIIVWLASVSSGLATRFAVWTGGSIQKATATLARANLTEYAGYASPKPMPNPDIVFQRRSSGEWSIVISYGEETQQKWSIVWQGEDNRLEEQMLLDYPNVDVKHLGALRPWYPVKVADLTRVRAKKMKRFWMTLQREDATKYNQLYNSFLLWGNKFEVLRWGLAPGDITVQESGDGWKFGIAYGCGWKIFSEVGIRHDIGPKTTTDLIMVYAGNVDTKMRASPNSTWYQNGMRIATKEDLLHMSMDDLVRVLKEFRVLIPAEFPGALKSVRKQIGAYVRTSRKKGKSKKPAQPERAKRLDEEFPGV